MLWLDDDDQQANQNHQAHSTASCQCWAGCYQLCKPSLAQAERAIILFSFILYVFSPSPPRRALRPASTCRGLSFRLRGFKFPPFITLPPFEWYWDCSVREYFRTFAAGFGEMAKAKDWSEIGPRAPWVRNEYLMHLRWRTTGEVSSICEPASIGDLFPGKGNQNSVNYCYCAGGIILGDTWLTVLYRQSVSQRSFDQPQERKVKHDGVERLEVHWLVVLFGSDFPGLHMLEWKTNVATGLGYRWYLLVDAVKFLLN